MPLVRTPLTGNQIVAMGSVSLQRNYTLTSSAGVTSFDVNEIPVGGLPSLMYWVRLNTALGGVVFEFRHRGGAHTPGDTMVWLPQKAVLFSGDAKW